VGQSGEAEKIKSESILNRKDWGNPGFYPGKKASPFQARKKRAGNIVGEKGGGGTPKSIKNGNRHYGLPPKLLYSQKRKIGKTARVGATRVLRGGGKLGVSSLASVSKEKEVHKQLNTVFLIAEASLSVFMGGKKVSSVLPTRWERML